LIRDGRVQVNGRAARASQRVRSGDEVRLEVPPADPAQELLPEDRPLEVVHEDAWLLVIDKPAGLVVHPGAGVARGTLVHALLHHAPEIQGVGGPGRPGIVHRLDKDTSGLLVVAKHERAHRGLVEAIAARQVRRVYRALVWGAPRGATGRIEAAIARDPRDRKRMAVARRGGRPAATRWRLLESWEPVASDLELTLETGRTHQIRVHLAHAGTPVIGDPVYGGRVRKMLSLTTGQRSLASALLETLRRQALHASELSFRHPITGVEHRFTAPVPEDFERALDLLRSAHRPGRPRRDA
jgi:23S rRNA pseudouridine1911/1915/1917 synthase